MSSKILMYSGTTTGVTTNGDQYAFFINENGLPTVKHGSETITFGTSGYAFAGSSGSSGANGSSGLTGTSGVSGTSGQDGATGVEGPSGTSGSSGESGSSGINGVDGATGTSGTSGLDGTFFGSSGSSGANGSSGSSGVNGTSGSSGFTRSLWTPIISSGITESADSTFTRFNTGGVWNEGVSSQQGFETPYAGAELVNTLRCVIGLNSDPQPQNDLATMDYAIGITTSGGNPTIYESNVLVYTHGSPVSAGDTYGVTYDGYNVKYYINGTLVHTTPRALSGLLYLDSSLFTGGSGSAFTNVVFGPYTLSGVNGTSGVSGSSGVSGVSGTSGTSAPAGGGGDTLYTQQVSISASQPTINGSANQWRAIYGDGNQLDQGSGGAYDTIEYGFIQPFFLAPGETIEKVGFYFMDYTASGTAAFKVIICDKHPDAYLPWNLLHSEELTFTHDDVDNKFISWDYDFTNTGTTVNTYFVYILFPSENPRTFELCRTVQYPQHLTYDYRLVTSGNRYDANSHWLTAYTSIYSSLPATMSSVLASNLYYNNQRGGHMYYQTSRI